MKVLVTNASRHGSTAGIAERIASRLNDDGVEADVRPVDDVSGISGYDAVVIGGAAYMAHWSKDALRFAKRHQAELASRPVWLFSSGPLGTDRVDKDGKDVLESSRPGELDTLAQLLDSREERVFFGAYDPDAPPIGFGERMLRHLPAAADALPSGDFRDWPAIDAWADEISHALVVAGPSPHRPDAEA
jgi:menaquinone-dependent protoporphyrinogen oxidase